MAKHFSYRALIKGLENLYSKIALHVLDKRINSYHSQASDGKRKHHDGIKAPMMNFIESTVAQAVKSNYSAQNDEHADTEINSPPHHPRTQHTGHHELSRERIDELSKYFKERNKGADLHPPIREKLEHSVWEHIHATIRRARQGDERNAKMHLNIATTACKELAHYMNDEEYQAFVSEAESYMDKLNTPNKIT